MSIGVLITTRAHSPRRSATALRSAAPQISQAHARRRVPAWIALVLLLPAALIIGVIKQANTHSTAARSAVAIPARFVLHPHTVTRAALVGTLHAQLTVSPLIPGANHFVLSLRDARHPLPVAAVSLRATMPGMAMRPLRFTMTRGGAGRYLASGSLPMFGRWRIAALVAPPHARSTEALFAIPLDLPAELFTSQVSAGRH